MNDLAVYWCESCPSKNFRNFKQLIDHLNGSPHYLGILQRGFRRWRDGSWLDVTARFQLDDKKFNRLTDLLRYIDRMYGIHCCYVKGLTKNNRVVFLDGAARD